jgi:hypothetical protein
MRNLAALASAQGQTEQATQLYLQACRMLPTLLPLAVECGKALLEAGQAQEWLDLLPELADSVRQAGRVKLLEGQAALDVGDLARVKRLFSEAGELARFEIADLREGERSLSQLWFEYHERRLAAQEGIPIDQFLRERGGRARVRAEYPVPPEIDFRMSPD